MNERLPQEASKAMGGLQEYANLIEHEAKLIAELNVIRSKQQEIMRILADIDITVSHRPNPIEPPICDRPMIESGMIKEQR